MDFKKEKRFRQVGFPHSVWLQVPKMNDPTEER
jgi:hypothetical protein